MGREIVVIMGLGFVGAVMADAVDKETGEPNKFVIDMQRPSTRSFWKIPYINRGIPPVEAEDPEVYELIRRCVHEKKTLTASFTHDALSLADAVIFAVRHKSYSELSPEAIVEMAGKPLAVVDCFGLLDDAKIRRYIEPGCEVKALGRGHIKRLKDEVLQKRLASFKP